MRNVIVSETVSLDGFFAGPSGEIDWHVVDEEFNQHAIDLLNIVDTIIFGRITYQLFENYWPAASVSPMTSESDLEIAYKIDNTAKVVFSKTINKAGRKNTKLIREFSAEEILKMKDRPGKNMVIYGSASIVSTFMNLGLTDEYFLFVNPVVLGSGKPLFKNINNRHNLKLTDTKTFKSGIVLLHYLRV